MGEHKDDFPFLPVLVKDKDNQLAHDAGGVPLTLEMALTGKSPMAYGDTGLFPTKETKKTADKELFKSLHQAFAAVK
jgi:hypothetical protein